jgi:hypothetical protein
MMLKKGDTCYVRHEGVIKKAKYIEPSIAPKCHKVTINDGEFNYLLASSFKDLSSSECRFVCMTGLNKEKTNDPRTN